MKNSLLALLAAALLAPAASADVIEGSFNASSPLLRNSDVLALLVRRDPSNPKAGYAVLAEYTRLPFIPGPERLQVARWVPRLFAYRVEETGALDGMLGKVADFYEAEVDDAVEALSSLMEPMIMVVLGTLIGGMVIAMYLPIFKMGQAV